MLQTIGLDAMSQTTLVVFAVAVAMGASLAGWLTDAIMGSKGYGVIGNTMLVMVGVASGLAATRRFVGPMEMAQAFSFMSVEKMIVTRTDLTRRYGSVICSAKSAPKRMTRSSTASKSRAVRFVFTSAKCRL